MDSVVVLVDSNGVACQLNLMDNVAVLELDLAMQPRQESLPPVDSDSLQ
jgi:hypothetical protein